MDTVYVSALAALGGSAIGALASIGTSWLTQRYQNQGQRAAEKSARLEQIFGEFIDQASRVLADALTHQLEDPSTLVPLYATVGKLRLYASSKTVASADEVMSRILEAYSSPNIDFHRQPIRNPAEYDVLSAFIEACQAELERLGVGKNS